jgi:sodium/potassium-transporting ATPase subunit alpha
VNLKHQYPSYRSALVVEGRFIDTIDTDGWNYIFQFKELVFARTTPEHKLQIVIEAQRRDHVVAVTGDGTNDAPALRRANIGVAMGSGSAVARDAALSILLDDQFTAIVSAVEEGRALFANLRKVIAYQISGGCFGELLPVLATFFLGMPTPINSLMMVMVCVTNDTFSGIALMCEPPQNHMMLDKPRDRKKTPLVTLKLVNYAYFFMAIIQAIGMFGTYFLYMYERGPVNDVPTPLPADDEGDVEFPIGYTPSQLIGAWNWGLNDGELGEDMMAAAATGSSVFFTALMVTQWAHLISVRNKAPYFYESIMNVHHSPRNIVVRMFKELMNSPPRWQIVLAMSLGALVANFFSETPALHEPCQTGSVTARYWGVALLFGLFVFVCGEIRKWMITIWPNCWLGRVTEC